MFFSSFALPFDWSKGKQWGGPNESLMQNQTAQPFLPLACVQRGGRLLVGRLGYSLAFDLNTRPVLPKDIYKVEFWHAHLNYACLRASEAGLPGGSAARLAGDQLCHWNTLSPHTRRIIAMGIRSRHVAIVQKLWALWLSLRILQPVTRTNSNLRCTTVDG